MYGGCESPGFLISDALAEPFFLKHGYRADQKIIVLHRILDQPTKMFDPRFVPMKQRFELEFGSPRRLLSWWHECIHGYLDPLQFTLKDKQTGALAARTLVWEMEPFSIRWQRPTVGIFDFEVNESCRRQSVGRFFLSLIMKYIQDQFFTLVEIQLEDTNNNGLCSFCAVSTSCTSRTTGYVLRCAAIRQNVVSLSWQGKNMAGRYMTRSSIGGGHNGLVTACYLARAKLKVLVLERRYLVGGACVTEENIFPGYKVSILAAYVNSLFSPTIIKELCMADSWVRPGRAQSLLVHAVPRRPASVSRPRPQDEPGADRQVLEEGRGKLSEIRAHAGQGGLGHRTDPEHDAAECAPAGVWRCVVAVPAQQIVSPTRRRVERRRSRFSRARPAPFSIALV